MRTQAKVMGGLTGNRLQEAKDDMAQFTRELQVVADQADQIQASEDQYKSSISEKLGTIHKYLRKVGDVLKATHKEPELEKILRDMDQIAQNVGMMENGERVMVARKKCGVTSQDMVARQMRVAGKEIEKVEQLESEREFSSAIEKMSVVKLAHKLKDVMLKQEVANEHEKELLTNEIEELRETQNAREKRLNAEVQALRSEKDRVFQKLTSLDLTEKSDLAELRQLIENLGSGAEAREQATAKENKALLEKAQALHSKIAQDAPKGKVKMFKKGQQQRVPAKRAGKLASKRLPA